MSEETTKNKYVTVAELIVLLQNLDPNLPVITEGEHGTPSPVETVEKCLYVDEGWEGELIHANDAADFPHAINAVFIWAIN